MNSSVSDSDFDNSDGKWKLAQLEKSRSISRDFLDSIGKADVVLYHGHFTGDDAGYFFPWSRQSETVSKEVLFDKFVKEKRRPAVMGFFGCSSFGDYVSPLLERRIHDVVFIGSDAIMNRPDDFRSIFVTLDGLLRMQCSEGLTKFLEAASDNYRKNSKSVHRLYNFERKNIRGPKRMDYFFRTENSSAVQGGIR